MEKEQRDLIQGIVFAACGLLIMAGCAALYLLAPGSEDGSVVVAIFIGGGCLTVAAKKFGIRGMF